MALLLLASLTALAGDWPCPEFGECRAHVVLGNCQVIMNFEYSRRLQVKGTVPFWDTDEPKPCLMALRVGKHQEKFTFEERQCREIVDLFESVTAKTGAAPAADTELFNCEPDLHGGRVTLLHPEADFRQGNWKPLKRSALILTGAASCRGANILERSLVCSELDGPGRVWVLDLLSRVRWRLSGSLAVQTPDAGQMKLAPGDRLRGLRK